MLKIITTAALAVAAVGISSTAYAVPSLKISDGINPDVIITDNLTGDASTASGQVTWLGGIGIWSFNIHVGTTFPIMGTLANPYMDMSFNATSMNGLASNTLTLSFSFDGFGATNSPSQVAIGGVTAGVVNYSTYYATGLGLFNLANQISTQGPFTGAFSATGQTANINAGLYSLTQVVTITHGAGSRQTTGDALLVSIPVPDRGSTLLLVGGGLIALGLLRRRRIVR